MISIIIIVICVGLAFVVIPLQKNYITAVPDETYARMEEIEDNKSLIGFSKDLVEEMLGEKTDKYKDKKVYHYSAGTLTDYATGGHRKLYIFNVYFDENDFVKSTLIRESP